MLHVLGVWAEKRGLLDENIGSVVRRAPWPAFYSVDRERSSGSEVPCICGHQDVDTPAESVLDSSLM